ncbi:MAG: hypothetical protein PHV68_06310 [Candidatus Gastranaerophilales bacterium]|nr:hypothetical protein [Candidatus Gastranaerophilales bacterium]
MPKTKEIKENIKISQKEILDNIEEFKKQIQNEMDIKKNPQNAIGAILLSGLLIGLLYKPVKTTISKTASGLISAYLVKKGVDYIFDKFKNKSY